MRLKIITLMAILLGYSANAQNTLITDDAYISPRFFVAIIAGVLLALAFQFVLTALSVALGITMIGDVRKNFVKASVRPNNHVDRSDYEFDQDHNTGIPMGVKVTSGIGIWSLITSCLSLFGATVLAINLSVFGNTTIDITIALVIWALFFLLLFYLETKLLNTLVGGLISTATSGLKASASAVKDLFAPSDSKKVEKVVNSTIGRIKDEIHTGMDTSEISKVLDSFLKRVDNKIPDYEALKKDVQKIVRKNSNKNISGKWMAIQQVLTKAIDENSESTDENSENKVVKIKELLQQTKEAYDRDPGTIEGIKNVVEEFGSVDKETINQQIDKIRDYISEATPERLTPEHLKKDLKMIINDPKTISTIISSKFKDFNEDKLITYLSKNTSLDREKLEDYATKIKSAVESVVGEFDKENDERMIKRLEDRIALFFNSTDREELNYEDLKDDAMRMFNNPKDSFEIVKKRVSQFDGNTLKALITNNRYISEAQIDNIIDSFEDGKEEIASRISKIEARANQEFEMLKRKAVIKAEHTRKTAASASWWLVITAVASAGAAILGGWI